MYREIIIENKKIPMVTNGATLLEYRRFFERDMFGDYISLTNLIKNNEFEKIDSLTMARMMWVCAYSANNKIDEFEEWLKKFENPFSIYCAVDEFVKFIERGLKSNVKPKKQQTQKKG